MKNQNLDNQIRWILQEKHRGKMTVAAKKDIARLKKGEPVDYIIGFMDFLGSKIDLSKKPLIPRLETEYWVENTIAKMSRDFQNFENHKTSVLDMFAGSGCIGVSIIMSRLLGNRGSSIKSKILSGRYKNVYVVFAEKNKKFIEQIKINCRINKIKSDRYKILQSDIFENVKGRFDYMFANPPYISTIKKSKIQKSVLQYEPKQALFGGVDGLFYIRKFLADAKSFLSYDGKIYMEFDSIQKRTIENLLKKLGYKNWEFCKDQNGKWRWIIIYNKI